jgi:fatty acid desaturase
VARRSTLRASDLDREHIAERLRNATAEGRLLASELEERLSAALTARTYGELDPLVADLPAVRDRGRRSAAPLAVKAAFVLAAAMAVLAVLAMVTLIILGIAGAWLAWMFFAWFCFGRRGHRRYGQLAQRSRPPRSGHASF